MQYPPPPLEKGIKKLRTVHGGIMPRARNIKPAFFKNELLIELPFETRLLFIGLWTLADREGRLEDRPKRIKMEIFPADNIDIESCLNQLHSAGFIIRYKKAPDEHHANTMQQNNQYIQVVSFLKHQHPHMKEAESVIPAPDEHHANTMLARLNPESLNLNPESLNLNPDCGTKAPPQKNKIGTRLSEDWDIPEEWGLWSEKEFNWDYKKVCSEADKFKDFWISKSGKDASKLNWEATWRNWCRKSQEGF